MKRTRFTATVMMLVCIPALMFSGCGSVSTAEAGAQPKAEEAAQTEVTDEAAQTEVTDETAQTEVVEEALQPEVTEETPQAEEPEEAAQPEEADKTEVPEEADETASTKAIVWLGDSLTQGSLGHKNDNLANAPYEKLKEFTDVPVEGYGFYAYRTHDILWVYTDADHLDQEIDPDKTYVFWVGSNDWANDGDPNSDTAPVINDVDKFIADGNVKNYIVIGTTSRHILGDLYIPINEDLKNHYGEHYLDPIDIINEHGFAEDNTHLSQGSYDAIAEAVYEKLKSLGYIK